MVVSAEAKFVHANMEVEHIRKSFRSHLTAFELCYQLYVQNLSWALFVRKVDVVVGDAQSAVDGLQKVAGISLTGGVVNRSLPRPFFFHSLTHSLNH